MVHMIRYVEYLKKKNVNGTTNFPNLGLVRTVKFTCDVACTQVIAYTEFPNSVTGHLLFLTDRGKACASRQLLILDNGLQSLSTKPPYTEGFTENVVPCTENGHSIFKLG